MSPNEHVLKMFRELLEEGKGVWCHHGKDGWIAGIYLMEEAG